MAGLQELPPSSALPQVRLTMELMGHGQWQRGNTNSCFMSCTMLTHPGAEFSLEQGQQQGHLADAVTCNSAKHLVPV